MLKNGRIVQPRLDIFAKKWHNVDFSKFPTVGGEYHNTRRQYVEKVIGNKKMSNFILYSLAKCLVNIYEYFSPELNTGKKIEFDAAIAFVKYITDNILKDEKSVSDPGILRGKLLDIEDDEVGDAIEAEYDDRYTDIDEHFDPFSLESTGIDERELVDNITTGDD